MLKTEFLATLAVLALLVPAFSLAADEYADSWGLAIGSQAPVIDALDQDGKRRSLESLAGEHGLLLFMNRSADW